MIDWGLSSPRPADDYATGPSEEESRASLAGRSGFGDQDYFTALNRLAYEQPTDVQRARAAAAQRLIAGLNAPRPEDLEAVNNAGVEQRSLDRARSQASEIARRGFTGGYAQAAQVKARQGRDVEMEQGRQKALYDAAAARNRMRAQGLKGISDIEEEIQRRRMLGYGTNELERQRANQETMDKANFVMGAIGSAAEGAKSGMGGGAGTGGGGA